MQFRVPQFIDIEDKIFGPFTFKQFIYLVGGAGMSYLVYRFLPLLIAIPLILPIAGTALALTFYKVNGQPFVDIMQSYFNYLFKNKLYIWKKSKAEKIPEKKEVKEVPVVYAHKLTGSKLKDIAWGLDVLDMNKK